MKPRSYKQATKMMIPRWKAIANADSLGTMLDIYSSDDDALCVLQESKEETLPNLNQRKNLGVAIVLLTTISRMKHVVGKCFIG